MADRVVSDQQLDGWEQHCRDEDFDWRDDLLALIAEVRASHAREAEARQAQAHTVAQFSSSAEAAKRYALEAEVDRLQQRIDKALEQCHNLEQFGTFSASAYDIGGKHACQKVRAALNGEERDVE